MVTVLTRVIAGSLPNQGLKVFVQRKESVRILLALVAQLDLELQEIDVSNAFLGPALREYIFMHTPEGIHVPTGMILQALKSLYGLKKSARYWYEDISSTFISMGFRATRNPCIFLNDQTKAIIAIHIDDMMIAAPTIETVNSIKIGLNTKYKMKDLGEAKWFLKMEIIRDRLRKTLRLDHSSYVRDLLQKYGYESVTPLSTPFDNYSHLMKAKPGEPLADQCAYQTLFGEVLYLSQLTRPDISFHINRLSQFTLNPSMANWNGLLKILRYLSGTKHYCITYSYSDDFFNLIAYCDSDYAADKQDRLLVFGGYSHSQADQLHR